MDLQVTVEDTQPRMSSMTPNLLEHDLDWSRTETGQSASVSQVSVPRDPQGSLDFNFFPVRVRACQLLLDECVTEESVVL